MKTRIIALLAGILAITGVHGQDAREPMVSATIEFVHFWLRSPCELNDDACSRQRLHLLEVAAGQAKSFLDSPEGRIDRRLANAVLDLNVKEKINYSQSSNGIVPSVTDMRLLMDATKDFIEALRNDPDPRVQVWANSFH